MAVAPVSRRTATSLGALATGAALLPGRTRAADYPTKPIRIVVPYAPGGTTDIATRMVGEPLGRVLGQPVVVENKPGANSVVGAGAVATSPPDGHTLAMVIGAHAAKGPTRNKCFKAAAGWVRWCSSTRRGTGRA